jgi:hypothetical protein
VTAIVWTFQAIEDVEAIRTYIARDSPHYASLMAERIVESVERLKEFPRSGRVVPLKWHRRPAGRSFWGTTASSTGSWATKRKSSLWFIQRACYQI